MQDDQGTQLDAKTLQLEALLLDIAKATQQHGKRYFIGGGFAVDLAFGGLSRSHEDLDFYPLEGDTEWWKAWFRARGYDVSRDTDMEPLPNAFSVLSSTEAFDKGRDYLADVYPIAIASDGSISMAVKPGATAVWDGMLTLDGTRGTWPGKSWNKVTAVSYKGESINVEDVQAVLEQKLAYIKLHPGEQLTEKHLRDFARAGIKPGDVQPT